MEEKMQLMVFSWANEKNLAEVDHDFGSVAVHILQLSNKAELENLSETLMLFVCIDRRCHHMLD